MAAILPLVKKYDAAIIALPNDHDEIPMEADKRLDLTAKIIRVATTEYGIAQADIVIDPLAMPIGADTGNSLVTMECMRRIRDEFGVNMTCGASNVSFGMPDRHTLDAAWLPMAMTAGLTSAIMDARTPQIVEAVKAADVFLNHDDWGMAWIAAHRAKQAAKQAAAHDLDDPEDEQPRSRSRTIRREGLIAPPGAEPAAHDGTGRVQLSFTVEDKEAPPTHRQVRVPPGVSVFDSASWNGIAIDSTCGGHGTCHKCKVRVSPATPVTRHDARTFSPGELDAGWRLACLVQATRDHDVVVPPLVTRPKAATVGVGRQVILRPAVQKRYVELTEPTLEDQRSDLARLLDAIDDLEPVPDLHALRRLPKVLREADFKVTAVIVDEALVDVEPGDTTSIRYAIAFDLGTTTVVATLLDLVTGTPVARRLDAQQAAALRRRRDLADQRDDARPRGPRPPPGGRLPDAGHPGRAGLPRGWRRPGARLRGRARRQRHHDRPPARHRPRAVGRRAVRADHRHAARRSWRARSASSCTPAPGSPCSPPWARTSAATSWPACSPPAWTATSGSGCSSTSAPTARSSSATASGSCRRRRRPGRRSRVARSAAACGRPTAPSRSSSSSRRRRRARRHR